MDHLVDLEALDRFAPGPCQQRHNALKVLLN
jgi:hypothetical protein